ncbi:MAG: ATP-grasp domain-containing protein [Limisphaerales bacterium]
MTMTQPGRVFNVLVFPGGTEIGLEIRQSLADVKNVRLFSAAMNVSNHAPYVFTAHFIVPSIHERDWVAVLNRVVVEQRIDYIFPAYDDVQLALLENADQIRARIVSSPLETCAITRSKRRTYELFAGVLPVPRFYNPGEAVEEYPVFVKPDRGQGSQNARLVENSEQLRLTLQEKRDYLTAEYLPGMEYTIDCFSDREHGLLFCSGRERVRMRSGIAMHSRPAIRKEFSTFARIIASRLAFHGAWFFQLKEDRAGVPKLLEIGPRIAGTMALQRVQGVNFPLLSLYEQERVPVRVSPNNVFVEIDRALVNRYRHEVVYHWVYVDLDDTLLVGGTVNTRLIQFLYQCLNRQVGLTLLTRHTGDIAGTLERHRLQGLFDEVIVVPSQASKAAYTRREAAILIDDSFRERQEVFQKRGLLTFDCSMLEMLIDERK